MSQILFLSAWFPFPADNGSKLRIQNLLRGLAQQHDVTLITFYRQKVRHDDIEAACPVSC